MLDSETEQTNSDDGARGRSESDNSGDSDLSLDSLLNEYQQETKPKAEPKPDVQTRLVKPDLSELDPVIKFAKARMEQEQRDTFEKDVLTTVDEIAKGEAFEGLPKNLVHDMVIARAFHDPSFDKAFQNRAEDPSGWKAAKKAAAADLAERVKDVARKAEEGDRDDIEAAKAAVQDVSDTEHVDTGPSVAQMRKMSDADFNQFLEEELAKVH